MQQDGRISPNFDVWLSHNSGMDIIDPVVYEWKIPADGKGSIEYTRIYMAPIGKHM